MNIVLNISVPIAIALLKKTTTQTIAGVVPATLPGVKIHTLRMAITVQTIHVLLQVAHRKNRMEVRIASRTPAPVVIISG